MGKHYWNVSHELAPKLFLTTVPLNIMSKIAVVTGANKGIGFAIAHGLAREGFHVFVGARDTEKGEEAAEKIRAEGYSAQFITIDVTDEASIVSAAREIADAWEGIDVLVNNAAINLDGKSGILETPLQTFEDTFKTNVWGVLLTTQAFWPLLQHSAGGRVINVSSGLGRLYDMENESPAYAASKTTVNALTRQFADAGGGKISVNCINPGWVKTDMGGQNAERTPDQGAAIVIKLATMENPPTGQFLQDDGEIGW